MALIVFKYERITARLFYEKIIKRIKSIHVHDRGGLMSDFRIFTEERFNDIEYIYKRLVDICKLYNRYGNHCIASLSQIIIDNNKEYDFGLSNTVGDLLQIHQHDIGAKEGYTGNIISSFYDDINTAIEHLNFGFRFIRMINDTVNKNINEGIELNNEEPLIDVKYRVTNDNDFEKVISLFTDTSIVCLNPEDKLTYLDKQSCSVSVEYEHKEFYPKECIYFTLECTADNCTSMAPYCVENDSRDTVNKITTGCTFTPNKNTNLIFNIKPKSVCYITISYKK